MLGFEREFLKQAVTWIRCRWRVMQGDMIEDCNIPFDISYDMLGCLDSLWEMRLLCAEVKSDPHAR